MQVTPPSPSSLPQTSTAIAQSSIFPGAAVAQSADQAVLAGSGLLATHICNLGAQTKGIASLVSSGPVFLDNWTLATGSKTLTTGATYYAGAGGKLVTTGGQPVGIATSPTTLQVTVQSQAAQAGSATSLLALQAQIAALAAQINSISGAMTKSFSGTFAIANASNAGTVTGLGITTFMPIRAVCTVRKPVGGLTIGASSVDTTITQDGFQFTLTSLTDSANYKLDFTLTP